MKSWSPIVMLLIVFDIFWMIDSEFQEHHIIEVVCPSRFYHDPIRDRCRRVPGGGNMVKVDFGAKCSDGFRGLLAHSTKSRKYFACTSNAVLTCKCDSMETFNRESLKCEERRMRKSDTSSQQDSTEECQNKSFSDSVDEKSEAGDFDSGWIYPPMPINDINHKIIQLQHMISSLRKLRAAKRVIENFTPSSIVPVVATQPPLNVVIDPPPQIQPQLVEPPIIQVEPALDLSPKVPKARMIFPRKAIETFFNFLKPTPISDNPEVIDLMPAEAPFETVNKRSYDDSKDDDNTKTTEQPSVSEAFDASHPQVKNRIVSGQTRIVPKSKKPEENPDFDFEDLGMEHNDSHETMELYDLIEYYHEANPNKTLWTKEGDLRETVKVRRVGNTVIIITTPPAPTQPPTNQTAAVDGSNIETTTECDTELKLSSAEIRSIEALMDQTNWNSSTSSTTPDPSTLSTTSDSAVKSTSDEPATFPYPPIENLVVLKPAIESTSEKLKEVLVTEMEDSGDGKLVETSTRIGKRSFTESAYETTLDFSVSAEASPTENPLTLRIAETNQTNQFNKHSGGTLVEPEAEVITGRSMITTTIENGFEEYYEYYEYESFDPPINKN